MISLNNFSGIKSLLLVISIQLIAFSLNANPMKQKVIKLSNNELRIVFSNQEDGPIKIALNALLRDFDNVLNFEPKVVNEMSDECDATEIVVVNRSSGLLSVPSDKVLELDGFESHRAYADSENNRIYVEGFDLRGNIFAIYTFSEKILGVPPLHYRCFVAWNERTHPKI